MMMMMRRRRRRRFYRRGRCRRDQRQRIDDELRRVVIVVVVGFVFINVALLRQEHRRRHRRRRRRCRRFRRRFVDDQIQSLLVQRWRQTRWRLRHSQRSFSVNTGEELARFLYQFVFRMIERGEVRTRIVAIVGVVGVIRRHGRRACWIVEIEQQLVDVAIEVHRRRRRRYGAWRAESHAPAHDDARRNDDELVDIRLVVDVIVCVAVR